MVNSARTRDTRVVVPVALRALEAQRLVSLIAYAISPALAAGLIAYVHMGESATRSWSPLRCLPRCSS